MCHTDRVGDPQLAAVGEVVAAIAIGFWLNGLHGQVDRFVDRVIFRRRHLAEQLLVLGDGDVVADGPARDVLAGSLFAPQVLRVVPPFLTVAEVAAALTETRT